MVGGSNPPLISHLTQSKQLFFVDALVQKKKDVVQHETLYPECNLWGINFLRGKPLAFSQLGELKHLSNPRKRNQPRFRKYRRENMEKTKHLGKSPPKDVEKSTKEGESPVDVASKVCSKE